MGKLQDLAFGNVRGGTSSTASIKPTRKSAKKRLFETSERYRKRLDYINENIDQDIPPYDYEDYKSEFSNDKDQKK